MHSYFNELVEFALKWKLNSRWSGGALLILDALDLPGFQKKGYIPFRDLIFLSIPKILPLQIKVDAWDIILLGRKKVLSKISSDLREYESRIRKVGGMKRYPSGLKRHAFWWFEHYVVGKTYKQISYEGAAAYEETIKRKVWEFSNLVGIKKT